MTSSANARLRLQKPDWSQVLKFSCLTQTTISSERLNLETCHLSTVCRVIGAPRRPSTYQLARTSCTAPPIAIARPSTGEQTAVVV